MPLFFQVTEIHNYKTVYVITGMVDSKMAFIRPDFVNGFAQYAYDAGSAATFKTKEHASHWIEELILDPKQWWVMPWTVPDINP